MSQDFPRADKRRLKGERKQLDADTDRAALNNERRMVRRDASLAWLDVYEAEQGLTFAQRLVEKPRCKCSRSKRTTATARHPRPTG